VFGVLKLRRPPFRETNKTSLNTPRISFRTRAFEMDRRARYPGVPSNGPFSASFAARETRVRRYFGGNAAAVEHIIASTRTRADGERGFCTRGRSVVRTQPPYLRAEFLLRVSARTRLIKISRSARFCIPIINNQAGKRRKKKEHARPL